MEVLKCLVALSFLTSGSVFAKTWIATCTDGKNIQYNQTENGTGFMYMKVKDSSGNYSIYQMARLEQTFSNGTAICGTVLENGTGNSGKPITQLCANKSRKTIYVKYKHPYDSSQPVKSGVFCKAKVVIR